MILSMILAMAENRTIGHNNQMPWHLSDELKRFKKLTTGHSIIMGRKTFESLGRPLPYRHNIVITRNRDYQHEGIFVVHRLVEAIELAKMKTKVQPTPQANIPTSPQQQQSNEAFVIGGAELYRQAWPRVQKLYLTLVHAEVQGDTFFDKVDLSSWQCLAQEPHAADAKHEYAYTCYTYLRKETIPLPTNV